MFFLRKLTESQVHLHSNRISTILIKGTIHPWENHCCFLTLKGIKVTKGAQAAIEAAGGKVEE